MFKLELSKFSKQIIWCDSLQVKLVGLNGIKVLSTLTFLLQLNYLLKSAFQSDFPSLPILFINSKDYFYLCYGINSKSMVISIDLLISVSMTIKCICIGLCNTTAGHTGVFFFCCNNLIKKWEEMKNWEESYFHVYQLWECHGKSAVS